MGISGIYLLSWEAAPSPNELEACLARVSPEKRGRLRPMKSSAAMTQSLFAELLARVLICESLQIPNSGLHFAVKPGGKPYLDGIQDFHYNISHTNGAVAVATAREPVGVDVERRSRRLSPRVARRVSTQAELDALEKEQNVGLLELWTKKEALLKWSGRGFAGSLSGLSPREEAAPPVQTFYTPEFVVSLCCADSASGIEPVSLQDFYRRVAALEEIV